MDAVAIFAVLRSKGAADKTVFVRQYRPPMQGYTIELPAGLVDAGETLEQGGLRFKFRNVASILPLEMLLSTISYRVVAISCFFCLFDVI